MVSTLFLDGNLGVSIEVSRMFRAKSRAEWGFRVLRSPPARLLGAERTRSKSRSVSGFRGFVPTERPRTKSPPTLELISGSTGGRVRHVLRTPRFDLRIPLRTQNGARIEALSRRKRSGARRKTGVRRGRQVLGIEARETPTSRFGVGVKFYCNEVLRQPAPQTIVPKRIAADGSRCTDSFRRRVARRPF